MTLNLNYQELGPAKLLALLCLRPTGKETVVNPWQACSSEKQTSKHQGEGNIRETCWGARRGEQPLGLRGVVQLGFSLGKLQQDTASSVSRKYEHAFAQKCNICVISWEFGGFKCNSHAAAQGRS